MMGCLQTVLYPVKSSLVGEDFVHDKQGRFEGSGFIGAGTRQCREALWLKGLHLPGGSMDGWKLLGV